MPALIPGEMAPAFSLRGVEGKSLSPTTLGAGQLAVICFYKATCPTCMLTLPFLEKLYRHHAGDASVHIVTVAEESAASAKEFMKVYGLTLPTALDEPPYKVSDDYGLTNVPTTFLVTADGTIERTLIGFSKKEYQALANRLGEHTKRSPAPLFEGSSVPEMKPG